MYKICFIDDETINHKLLEKMVDWNNLGYTIAGTATDGYEALELIRLVQPDLIFVDIKMPRMDGIECIRRLREFDQKIQIVLITAFSEFEYAKKAIRYQVSDYLLKPVNRKDLTETAAKIKETLDKQKESGQLMHQKQDFLNTKIKIQFQEALEAASRVSQQAMNPPIHTPIQLDESKYPELLKAPVCVFDLYFYQSLEQGTSEQNILEMISEIERLFNQFQATVYCKLHFGSNRFLFVTEFIADKLDLMRQVVAKTTTKGLEVDCYYFQHAMHKHNWQEQLQTLITTPRAGFYKTKSDVYCFDSLESELTWASDNFDSGNWDEPIFDAFEQINPAKLLDYLEEQFMTAANSRLQSTLLTDFCINFLVALKLRLKEFFAFDTFGMLRGVDIRVFQNIQKYDVLYHEMSLVVTSLFDSLVVKLRSYSRNYQLALKARSFAIKHFRESDFSIKTVAEHENLSKNYFITVFKEEMQISFWDYVTELRMDEAKRLLGSTDYTCSMISQMVGYKSEYHFARKFKEKSGKTPNQFRHS